MLLRHTSIRAAAKAVKQLIHATQYRASAAADRHNSAADLSAAHANHVDQVAPIACRRRGRARSAYRVEQQQ